MTRVVVAVVAVLGAGCNPLVALAESASFGAGARATLAEACCDCLAREELVDFEDGCPADGGTIVDAGDVDGGMGDAGEIDAGHDDAGVVSPCLCDGLDADTCKVRLLRNEDIVVVGQCVRRDPGRDGPCGSACSGVLAYPE